MKAVNYLLAVLLASSWTGVQLAEAQEGDRFMAVHINERGATWIADINIKNNKVYGSLSAIWDGEEYKNIRCNKSKLKKNNKFKIWCKTTDTRNRSLKGDLEAARLSGEGRAGGADFRFVSGGDLEEFLRLYEKDKSLTTDQYLDNK